MKLIILFFAAIISAQNVTAQSSPKLVNYSLKNKKDHLVELTITGPSLYIEGYDGDDLTIEPYNIAPSKNIIADSLGLKNITSLITPAFRLQQEQAPVIKEYTDRVLVNFGVSFHEAFLIKIPRNTHLKLSATGSKDRKVVLKNLTGEVDVRGAMPLIEIDNITGPLTVNSNAVTTSKIIISNIKFKNSPLNDGKALLYLSSFMSDFDISLPEDIKANVNIKVDNGDIYSDMDIVKTYGASNNLNTISGKINGGGAFISIISTYGNVAIRKQKE
ncbi:MAG: hypothetical protein ABI367_07265 [Mucilaginibacter sp.]